MQAKPAIMDFSDFFHYIQEQGYARSGLVGSPERTEANENGDFFTMFYFSQSWRQTLLHTAATYAESSLHSLSDRSRLKKHY